MSLNLAKCALVATPFVLGAGSVINNGPYRIDQQILFTPGTIDANIWPTGTVVQKLFVPGSFAINVTR